MHKKRTTALCLLAVYLLGLALYWGGNTGSALLRDIFYLVTPLIGVVAGVSMLRSYGLNGQRAKTILLLTVGLGCWFIGESLFTYYQYMHSNPFPSIADVFYLVAYPVFFAAFMFEVKSAHVNWRKFDRAILFLLATIGFLLSIIVSYFGIFLAYNVHETFLSNVISMGYGVGDLVLILASILLGVLAWEFRGGKLSRTWIVIVFGFALILVADILFAIDTSQYKEQIWVYKNIIDSFFMGGYLFLAYGIFDFGFSLNEAREKMKQLAPANKS